MQKVEVASLSSVTEWRCHPIFFNRVEVPSPSSLEEWMCYPLVLKRVSSISLREGMGAIPIFLNRVEAAFIYYL